MQDIYRLVKHNNFSAEYVESISPAERGLFIMYHDKEIEEQKKQNNQGQPQGPTIGSAPDNI